MKLFKKMADWASGNFEKFEKENQVYTNVMNELDNITTTLNTLVENYSLLQATELKDDLLRDLVNVQSALAFQKNRMKTATSIEQQKIMLEIQKLKLQYEEIILKIKNALLKNFGITEILQSTYNINGEIYRNPLFQPFQEFHNKNIIQKKWTVEELDKLSNNIGIRRSEIIPYLIQMEDIKKK